MAMLMTNEVFARTWGDRAGPVPETEYWPALIARCRETRPDFLFMAEVYWDMESMLQQQGFDLCYDKRLYDRLVRDPPNSVRGHLQADGAYQQRLIRFIENHDEPRAALTFGPTRERAAAVVISTLQGARLYHDGQLEGFRTHVPIQLGRGPDEPPDPDLRAFYRRLLRAAARARTQCDHWRLCDCTGCGGDPHPRLVNQAAEQIARIAALEAFSAAAVDRLIIDIRSQDNRDIHGVIPGSVHIPRTVLEWRIATDRPWRNPPVGGLGQQLIPFVTTATRRFSPRATLSSFASSGRGRHRRVRGLESRGPSDRAMPASALHT
jgi:hypothetical protein